MKAIYLEEEERELLVEAIDVRLDQIEEMKYVAEWDQEKNSRDRSSAIELYTLTLEKLRFLRGTLSEKE